MTGVIVAIFVSFILFAFGVTMNKEMLVLIAIWLISMFILLEVVEKK